MGADSGAGDDVDDPYHGPVAGWSADVGGCAGDLLAACPCAYLGAKGGQRCHVCDLSARGAFGFAERGDAGDGVGRRGTVADGDLHHGPQDDLVLFGLTAKPLGE